MNDSEKQSVLQLLAKVTRAIGEAAGRNCEMVLHEIDDTGSTIVSIANGHITGRKVGDTLDLLGAQLLRHPPRGDLFNNRTTTKDGRTLCCSSIFLRDEDGQAFGALCINMDITGLLGLQEWLQGTLLPAQNVEEVLDQLMREAVRQTGKPISDLNREDKIAVVAHLVAKGAFHIRYSVDRIGKYLSLSRYTIYNYLEQIEGRKPVEAAVRPAERDEE